MVALRRAGVSIGKSGVPPARPATSAFLLPGDPMHLTVHRTPSLTTLSKHPNRNWWSMLLAVISFLPIQLGAQATSGIAGRITDGETGQPLSGAHISLPGT